MPPSTQQAGIRQSWQPRRLTGAPAWVWLFVRRLTATVLALVLVGLCAFFLYRFLRTENSYFVYLSAGAYSPFAGQPVRYVAGDLAAFEALNRAFAHLEVTDGYQVPLTSTQLQDKLRAVRELGIRNRDTLILFLTAHGVVRDGKAFLLCEPTRQPDENRDQLLYPVAELLKELASVSAGTKLLILDAGRANDDASDRLGLKFFPKLLADAVEEAHRTDPNLWVLCANAPFEISHVYPPWRKSAIGHVVFAGLAGRADLNEDGIIRLGELHSFVAAGVSNLVSTATSKRHSQTPLLLPLNAQEQAAEQHVVRLPASGVIESAEPFLRISGKASATTIANREKLANQSSPSEGSESAGKTAAGKDYAARSNARLIEIRKRMAELESSTDGMASCVFMPPVWHEIVERMQWCDEFIEADVIAEESRWRPLDEELGRIEKLTDTFSQYSAPLLSQDSLTRYISFAIRETIAEAEQTRALAKDKLEEWEAFKTFAQEYDALISRPTSNSDDSEKSRAQLDTLFIDSSKKVPRIADYYEFQLLSWRHDRQVPWELLRLALETRRTCERAAAIVWCGEGWARDRIEAADRLRWEGERCIEDRTDSDWAAQAEEKLKNAKQQYESAIDELRIVRDAMRARNLALLRAPQYVRWARHHQAERGVNQVRSDVRNLLVLIRQVQDALSTPSIDSVNQLRSLSDKLTSAYEALDKQVNQSDQVASLDRETTPTSNRAISVVHELTISNDQWLAAREQLLLERDFATLSGLDPTSLPEFAESIEQQPNNETDDDHVFAWRVLIEANEKLRQIHSRPLRWITALSSVANKSPQEKRDEAKTQLRHLDPCWLLLGPDRNTDVAATPNLAVLLRQAVWYDLLRWNSERFLHAQEDAPISELASLQVCAETYRTLAMKVGGPQIDDISPPQLSIDVAGNYPLELVTRNTLETSVTVRSHVPTDLSFWLVAQYDNSVLEVSGRDVLSRDTLRAEATALRAARGGLYERATSYPYHPALLAQEIPGFPAPRRLPAGKSVDFTIQVKRHPDAMGNAKLILQAISAGSFVRRELKVELPDTELPLLAVEATRDFWEANQGNVVLHPLPNREQQFALTLANRAVGEKKLLASVWKAGVSTIGGQPIILPQRAQSPTEGRKLLELFQATQLTPETPITLPASPDPVRLPLMDSSSNAAAAATSTGSAAAAPPRMELNHGLLVLLKEQHAADGEKWTIRRIEIQPLRPRHYLDAQAVYQRDTGQLQVFVRAKKGREHLVPPTGIKLALRVPRYWEQQPNKLQDILSSPDQEVRLDAFLVPTSSQFLMAAIDVDEYPRAFIFRIPRDQPATRVEPTADYHAVRIISPISGTPFRKPEDGPVQIPITLQVDAPYSAFDTPDSATKAGSYVEVGIDENQDLQLQNESLERFYSDRQVTILAPAFSADGTITLDTRVSDFQLELSSGLSERAANLIARLVTPNHEEWTREPIEVILDGLGPVVFPELHPLNAAGEIERGTELEVRILLPEEHDLSGIAKIEATLAGAEKWEEAKEEVRAQKWVARIKTDKLPLGRHSVLVRATDKVGNQREEKPLVFTLIDKKPVRKITPEEMKLLQANNLTGRVYYGNEPVADAEITLEGGTSEQIPPQKSDSNGRFTFPKVPPGKYILKASGYAKNRRRHGEIEVIVPPAPKPAEVRITLQQ